LGFFLDSIMKIKESYGLHIGVSNGGHIRLEQKREFDGDAVILLSAQEARLLISELRALIRLGAGGLLEECEVVSE
jgi:hypothetical protein